MFDIRNTATTTNLSNAIPERARVHFLETVENSENLSQDFRDMRENGLLSKISTHLSNMWHKELGQQDPKWHPEGDTFEHVCLVLRHLPKDASFALRLAAIFHDIGKPFTSFDFPDGGRSNKGHAALGYHLFKREIGPALNLSEELINEISELIKWHMFLHDINNPNIVSSSLKNYFSTHPSLDDMVKLQYADAMGTGQLSEERLKRVRSIEIQNLKNKSDL